MSFTQLGLSAPLLEAVARSGFGDPYPVQSSVIPAILAGNDVLGIARTGSGKTAAFVLPILQHFQSKRVGKNRYIKVLVLTPTRELSVQVGEVFRTFGKHLPRPVKSLSVYGGVSINPQMIQLQGVEVLVATPGRLLDLLDNNSLHLSELDILVLDEADKMLNLGFREEMERIFGMLPAKRQNLLFSATLGKDIDDMTKILLHDPLRIEIETETENTERIKLLAYLVSEARKGPLLRFLIRDQELDRVLVFTSSVHKADAVVNKLKINGITALALHSRKSQGARTDALRYFKSGEIRVLVATDLASRGIDIPFLPTVVNYELPRSPRDFIHRIGRTGRADASGQAISFIRAEDRDHFRVIQKKMGRRVDLVDTESFNLQGY